MKLFRRIQAAFMPGKHNRSIGQLQWQTYLLHSGLSAAALVLAVEVRKSDIPGYLSVYMWLRLKYQDKIIIHHAGSQVSKDRVPRKDQVIRIRFLPENMEQVLVL